MGNCWHHRRLLSAVVGSIVMLVGTAGTGHAQETLRWNFSPNQSWQLRLTQQTSTKSTLKGRSTTIAVQMDLAMRWQVRELIDEHTAKIDQTIQRIQINLRAGTADPVVFDSQNAQAAANAQALQKSIQPLIGATVTLTMSDRGELLEVEIPPAIAERLAVAEDARWREMFTGPGMRQLLGQASCVFPIQPLVKGDQWQAQAEFPVAAGGLKVEHQYTYQGLETVDERALARIDVQSQLQLPETGESPLTIKSQTQTGIFHFDHQAGYLARSQGTQKLETQSMYRGLEIDLELNSQVALVVEPEAE